MKSPVTIGKDVTSISPTDHRISTIIESDLESETLRSPISPLVRSASSPVKIFRRQSSPHYTTSTTVGEDIEYEQRPAPLMTPERRAHIIELFLRRASHLMKKRRAEMEKNGAFASLCLRDAFEGRLGNGLATNSNKSAFIFGIYRLQTDPNWMNLVIVSSAFLTLLTFIEPDSSVEMCADPLTTKAGFFSIIAPYIFHVHYFVWFLHAFDCGMKVFYQGVVEYFNHDWQQLYFITIALHFLDLCIFGRTYLTNPLRPVVALLRDRRGRRFFSVVKLILYQMQEFLMPLFAFVFVIAVGCFLTQDNDYHSMVYYGYNWLCLILTNDTFSRLFPEIDSSTDITSALLIFLLMYFGQGFIVNVLLGATLETFRSVSTAQIKKENRKRNQGLVKAFTVLDTHKQGRIQQAQFSTFIRYWKPELKTEQLNLYYELTCEGDTAGITVFQFLNIPNIFRYYFEKESVVTIQIDASNVLVQDMCQRLKPYCYSERWRPRLLMLRAMLLKLKVFYYLNYADIFLFFIQVQDKSLFLSIGTVPTVCNFINFCYFVELFLELSFREGDLYGLLTMLENIFLLSFTLGIGGVLVLDCSRLLSLAPAAAAQAIIFFRSLRCCRVLITNATLSAFCSSVLSVGPLFCENMAFGLVILYMHGMAGHLLFGPYLDIWATPISATITVQKLFLPFDLLDIMEMTMEKVHPMSILFFFIYFLMSIIVSNLSLSIILEWHAQMFEEHSKPSSVKETKNVSHEILFKTIKERLVARKTKATCDSFADVATKTEEMERYSKYRMYIREKKADYRLKFVDDIENLSDKDIHACQKYSNIDLAAFSKELNRQQKDLTWETDFVEHASKDHMQEIAKGSTFIVKGSPAVMCYLITAGTVLVERCVGETREEVDLGPINLVGAACLTPASKYKYTCTAVTAVECLAFSLDAVLSELDSDHAGQLLRMAHKTQLVLDDLFVRKMHAQEMKQKINRRRKSTSAIRHTQSEKGFF